VSTVKAETILPFRLTDRGFSKLALVKSKLHSTMGQQRIEALLLASVEKNIILELDDAELVAGFASRSDRQMMLDYIYICNATELGSYCTCTSFVGSCCCL